MGNIKKTVYEYIFREPKKFGIMLGVGIRWSGGDLNDNPSICVLPLVHYVVAMDLKNFIDPMLLNESSKTNLIHFEKLIFRSKKCMHSCRCAANALANIRFC